jgi:murein L,D-transpeptidase YcbB/YkuD
MHPKRHPLAPPVTALLVASLVAPLGCAKFPEHDAESRSPDARIRSMLTASKDPVLALATGDTIHFGDEVRAFYEARQYEAAWTDDEGFLPVGQALVAALRKADQDGLDLASYHGDEIPTLLERAKSDVEQDLPVGDLLGNLDMLMTEAYLRYTTDVLRGTIDPSVEGLDWKVPREDATDAVLLNRLLEDEDFDAALAELRPQVPFYDRLRDALPRYREVVAKGGWPTIAEGGSLGPGDRGAARRAAARPPGRRSGSRRGAPRPAVGASDVFDDRLPRR